MYGARSLDVVRRFTLQVHLSDLPVTKWVFPSKQENSMHPPDGVGRPINRL